MSLALYMDVHVPFAITTVLVLCGVDVLTAQADGAREMSDPDLPDGAMQLGRVVFTQDEDFVREAHRRQRTGEAFAGVIYAHQLKITIGQRVADLELIAKIYEPAEMSDRVSTYRSSESAILIICKRKF